MNTSRPIKIPAIPLLCIRRKEVEVSTASMSAKPVAKAAVEEEDLDVGAEAIHVCDNEETVCPGERKGFERVDPAGDVKE
jgi:hypothetical protein